MFLMNMFTDAQLVVSSDVAALLDRLDADTADTETGPVERLDLDDQQRATLDELARHGFVVDDRKAERDTLDKFFDDFRTLLSRRVHNTPSAPAPSERLFIGYAEEMHLTVLTTLQCNFACDYCLQGDHGDYNKYANKMSMSETTGLGSEPHVLPRSPFDRSGHRQDCQNGMGRDDAR